MKILITGANGEVGSDLVNFMVKKIIKSMQFTEVLKKKFLKKIKI